jgi:hypothetical protein
MISVFDGGDDVEEEMLKHHAKSAADDMVRVEGHKKNKKLMKHVKNELKERSKLHEAAIDGTKKKTVSAPAKKAVANKAPAKKK